MQAGTDVSVCMASLELRGEMSFQKYWNQVAAMLLSFVQDERQEYFPDNWLKKT